jgi:hypothetical protein
LKGCAERGWGKDTSESQFKSRDFLKKLWKGCQIPLGEMPPCYVLVNPEFCCCWLRIRYERTLYSYMNPLGRNYATSVFEPPPECRIWSSRSGGKALVRTFRGFVGNSPKGQGLCLPTQGKNGGKNMEDDGEGYNGSLF